MKVELKPSKVSGSILPPPSKSVLHRFIISSCMAKGTSKIENVVYSEDVRATINAFRSLGAEIQEFENHMVIKSPGFDAINQEIDVDCNESGSTIRFLIPLLSNNQKARFKGKSSLIKRPMTVYEDIFSGQGLSFAKTEDSIITYGRLSPGNYVVPGNISSQFISGLLFVLPILSADSTINITGVFESADYVDITVDVLKNFGINIKKMPDGYFIPGNQKYHPSTVQAETDFSQLAFYAVLATINNDLVIRGVNFDSLQPDRRILSIIESLGGSFEKGSKELKLKHVETNGSDIDVSQCPDLAPILGVLLAYSKGSSKIVNAQRLIIKESNRLLTTYETLKKFGVDVKMNDDSLEINHAENFNGGIFDSYNDHRIAMMISIAATIAKAPVTITRADAVNKSYPHFYEDLQSLGVSVKYI